jgi:hypothetical protein
MRDLRPRGGFLHGEGRPGRRRNKIAVKALKTNDPAKRDRFVLNDFNDLHGARRNVFFRLAKDFALFV